MEVRALQFIFANGYELGVLTLLVLMQEVSIIFIKMYKIGDESFEANTHQIFDQVFRYQYIY